jgi:hypothetical protein
MSTSKFEIFMSRKKTIYRFHLSDLINIHLDSKISKFNSHTLHLDMLIELTIKYTNEVGPNLLMVNSWIVNGIFWRASLSSRHIHVLIF